MKILICTFAFYPEKHGVAIAATLLAQGLVRSGHAVTVATSWHPAPELSPELSGINIQRFRVAGNANFRSRYHGETERYMDFVSKTDADVVILMCWQIWSTDLAIRALPRHVKVILHSHGVAVTFPWAGVRRIWNWFFWRPYALWDMPRMMRRVDRLVLPSHRLEGDRFKDHRLSIRLGTPREFIPNTVPEPGTSNGDFRKRHAIDSKTMALLVGHFAWLKNQVLAVRAFRRVQRDDITLVLVGSRNAYSDELESMLEASPGVRWRLLFDLDQDEIRAAYAEADFALITSRTEYQPLVALQAMAAGKPVVSTDVGCVGDLPGCLTVPSDPGSMADAIRELVDDAELRETLGREGREAFGREYSFEVVTKRWDRLVREVAGLPSRQGT